MNDAPAKKRRWPRPRFSLLTLLIFVMLCGSAIGLLYKRESWVAVDYNAVISGDRIFRSPSATQAPFLSENTRRAVFSPDAKLVASSGKDYISIVLWDTATGIQVRELKGHTKNIWSLCFSPDGQKLVSGSCDCTARVWDCATGEQLAVFRGPYSAHFSMDGQYVVAESKSLAWHQQRPEYWWGVAWLWEFWLTVVFGLGFCWSVWRDRRDLGRKRAPTGHSGAD